MDGHRSHIYNLPLVYDMYQHNVSVTVLESHTTHATQLMDQYPFEAFKVHFNDLLKDWCENNEGMPLPKAAFFNVFEPAWQLAMTQHNICSAFCVTGIFPLNLRAIPLEKLTLTMLESRKRLTLLNKSEISLRRSCNMFSRASHMKLQ